RSQVSWRVPRKPARGGEEGVLVLCLAGLRGPASGTRPTTESANCCDGTAWCPTRRKLLWSGLRWQCAVKRLGSSAGANPARQLGAPAGSSRSGGGGDDAVEAFETTGRLGGSASRQAATRVNAEQAPKQGDVGADPVATRGRPQSLGTGGGNPSRRAMLQGFHRGNGGGMPAHGDPMQHGKPRRRGRVTPDRQPARARSGRARWRRGPYERGARVMPGEQRG